MHKQSPRYWIAFNSVFRHSAECVLGHRCGQSGQRTGTDQGIVQSNMSTVSYTNTLTTNYPPLINELFFFFPHVNFSCLYHIWVLIYFLIHICRMNRKKRKLPIRRLPCRKPRKWLKLAHYLLQTSPLQRESLSLLLLRHHLGVKHLCRTQHIGKWTV